MLASQCKRSGLNLSITASHSRNTNDRWGCEFRKESTKKVPIMGVKPNVKPFVGSAVTGLMRRAMVGRDLWH